MIKKAAILAGYFLLAVFWFYQEAFGRYLFCFGDLTYYFYPYRYFLAESVRRGAWPLWNPYIHMGFPFLATLQAGVFYPFSLLYYCLPFNLAFNWFLIVHYPLGGFFMFLLGREVGLSDEGAAAAGLVFAFSGYLSSVLHMPTTLTSVIWLPLVCLYFRRSLIETGGRLRNLIFTGLLFGLMFLGGEPTILYGTVWILLIYLVYKKFGNWRELAFGLIGLLAALLVAAGLTAVQLLPFAELVLHSVRAGGIPYSEAAKFSFPFHKMIDLFFPYFSAVSWYPWFDSGWLKTTYLGIIPVLLSVAALFMSSERKKWLLALALLLIIMVMAGSYAPLPLYRLFFAFVPGFNIFRYPAKFAFMLVFIIAYLTGQGLDLVAANARRFRRLWVGWVAVAAASLVFLLAVLDRPRLFMILRPLFSAEIAAGQGSLVWMVTVPRDTINLAVLIGLAALLLVWLEFSRRWSWRPAVVGAGLAALIFLDLYTANAGANFSVRSEAYQVRPENIRLLTRDRSQFRYFIAPNAFMKTYSDRTDEFKDWGRALSSLRNRLTYNQNMIFGLAGLDGYESIKGEDQDRIGRQILALNSLEGIRALDMLNVKYLVTAAPFRQKGYRLLTVNREEFKGGKILLYENLNVLPRSYYVPAVKVIRDRQQALTYVFSRQFNPRREVVLEEKVRAPHGLWFTSEWFYPGWKAFVDGREAKIYRANYMFRAVPLPEQWQKVEFRYEPLSFRLGELVTLLTLFGLGVATLLLRRPRPQDKNKRSPE